MASYGFGGASSSSSLSPLAPPFMLDRPFSKLHSNPATSFCDTSHGTGLEHQSSIWNPLVQDTSMTNFPESGLRGIAYHPSADIYKKSDPQQEKNSDNAHLLALNSLARAVYDEYGYEPYPNGLPAPTAEAESYHPPYPLPAPASDQNMMSSNEPNYDLLTSFAPGSQGGYKDDTPSLSGVHYTPQWNGLWSGLTNTEQGKWLDIGGTFSSASHKPSSDSPALKFYANQEHGKKRLDLAGLSTSKSYVNKGQHTSGSSGPHAETSVSNKHSQDSSIAKSSTMTSADVLNGKPDIQNPIQQYFCKMESACGDLSGSHTNYGSYVAPVIRSSPSAVTEVGLSEITSTKCGFTSSKGSGRSNGVVEKPHNYPEYQFEYKDPYFTLGLGCPVADKAFTAHSLSPGSSSTKLVNGLPKSSDPEGGLNELFKPQSVTEPPQWTNTNYLNSKDDHSKILYSVEMPLDIPDGQNTSEDSPCWKGASSAHFSPFSDLKLASLELEKGTLSTNAAVPVASGRIDQTTKEKAFQPSGLSTGLFSFGLSGKDGSRFSSRNNSRTAYCSKNSQTPELTPEFKEDASRKNFVSFSVIDPLKDAKCGSVSLSDSSSVSTSVDHKPASSSLVNEATSKPCQIPGQELNVKLNIGMLVNAMKSMSELLSFHCSSNPAVAQELDSEILKQTIGNLNSCLGKEFDPAKAVEQVCLPHKKISSHHEVKKDGTDDKIDHAQFNKVPAVSVDNHDHDALEISRCDIFQRKSKDDEIIQAIKRVLVENLSCEEEEEEINEKPQLYKNLWLEAEAALCAVNTKARFNRMKKEMVQSNSQGADALVSPANPSSPADVNKSGNQSQIEKKEPFKITDVEKVECSTSFAGHDVLHKMLSNNAGRSSASGACASTDMESSVISRFNIIQFLSNVNSTKAGESTPPPATERQNHGPFDETQIRAAILANSGGNESSSVMSRFQILKSRPDHLDSSKTDDDSTPSPTYSDMAFPPVLDQTIQDSYFSSSSSYGIENGASTDDDPESGVMARFSMLKRRNEAVDLMMQQKNMPQVVEGDSCSRSVVEANITTALKDQGVGPAAGLRMSTGPLVEGWYDCSGSDWEHIVKEDLARQN